MSMSFTPIEPIEFSDSIMSMKGISKKTVETHLALYQGYVSKYNEISKKLEELTADDMAAANQTYSLVRALKVDLTFAWGGMVNHEIYFNHLGGKGGKPEGSFLEQIEKDFGSFDGYKKDVKATGMAARGWVWTGWNERDGRLFNYIGDAQNTYPVWGVLPILALDVYEHAYFMDFGKDRGAYIDAFFDNIDWEPIQEDFSAIMGEELED